MDDIQWEMSSGRVGIFKEMWGLQDGSCSWEGVVETLVDKKVRSKKRV
jgi:hypothetical protein